MSTADGERPRPGRDAAGVARRALIAGNWKMYKTQEQAEEYIQALLPRVSKMPVMPHIGSIDVAGWTA